MDAFELRNRLAIRRRGLQSRGARHESTDNKTRHRLMQTQHGEGIAMARADDCIDVVGRGAPIHQSESFRVNPLPLGEGGLRSKPGEGLHSCNSMRAANGWRGKASATNPSPDPASRGHPLPMGEGSAHHAGTFQISSAYSRIVRSRGKPRHPRSVENARTPPRLLIAPARLDASLRLPIAVEILRNQKMVVIGGRSRRAGRSDADRPAKKRRRRSPATPRRGADLRRAFRARRCLSRGFPRPPRRQAEDENIIVADAVLISTLAPSTANGKRAIQGELHIPVPDPPCQRSKSVRRDRPPE